MQLFALPCRSRFLAGSLVVLSFLIMPSVAHAAQWIVTYQANGKNTGIDSSTQLPYTTPWSATSPNAGGNAPSSYNSTQQTSQGTITPILTWTLDSGETVLPPAPNPAIAVVDVSINATIDGNNGRGNSPCHTSASDNYGDSFLTTSSGSTQTTYGEFSHPVQVSNPSGSTQISLPPITLNAACSTDGPNRGGGDIINVITTPINMVLAGTKIANGQYNILVGQGCTASLFAAAPGGRIYVNFTGYNWSVTGTTFQTWSSDTPPIGNNPYNPNASYYLGGLGSTSSPTAHWYWNDRYQATETVSCTAMISTPGGQIFPVSLAQQVTVYKPAWTATGTGGNMQVNATYPLGPGFYLYAGPTTGTSEVGGMNWLATVSPPLGTPFGSGTLQLVQLAIPNRSYTSLNFFNITTTHTDPENGQQGLDTSYPYPWTVSAPIYQSTDDPGHNLTRTSALSAIVADQFEDYLMYFAPGSVQCVPLAHFFWTTNGSATIPNTNNWANFGAGSAGAVTPSGGASPFAQSNSFPMWTQIDRYPNF